MASNQAQGPNPLRVRAGHAASLTKCFKSVFQLISRKGPIESAIELQQKLSKRYDAYLENHYWCLATCPDREKDLLDSHASYEQQHIHVSASLREYVNQVSQILQADPQSGPHPVSSPPFTISECESHHSSRFSRQATLIPFTKSRSHRTSQVSSSRSEKLMEARVQAEVARQRVHQIKSLQEMRRRRQALDDEIELAETEHKLQELNTELSVRQREEVREQLGSDYESDDEREDVTQPSKFETDQPITSAKSTFVSTKEALRNKHPQTLADAQGKEVPWARLSKMQQSVPSSAPVEGALRCFG